MNKTGVSQRRTLCSDSRAKGRAGALSVVIFTKNISLSLTAGKNTTVHILLDSINSCNVLIFNLRYELIFFNLAQTEAVLAEFKSETRSGWCRGFFLLDQTDDQCEEDCPPLYGWPKKGCTAQLQEQQKTLRSIPSKALSHTVKARVTV